MMSNRKLLSKDRREQDTNAITPIALTDFRGVHRPFGIRASDRRRHVYIVGKTGSGKTTLMETMIRSDLLAGRGLGVIDPHGELANRVLAQVPKHRTNDTILFDPRDTEYPVALNILERVLPEKNHLVASQVLGVFRKIWPEFWGPRLEHVFRNALLTIMSLPGSTLLEVMRLLVEERFRARVLRNLKDPVLLYFWQREFTAFHDRFMAEVLQPVQNKLGAFLASPLVRNIIGQAKESLRFREVMDRGRILIASLPKGEIGEEASALLGSVILSKFELAALGRADVPEARRPDFCLYVDEFPNFVTKSFAGMLSEARKYRLSLVLAHQYLDQVDEDVLAAILGNVGTMIAFRLGVYDAKALGPEFSPEFSPEDLAGLGKYHFILRLLVDGAVSRPFTAVTIQPPEDRGFPNHGETIRKVSRKRYAKPRVIVEEIVDRRTAE